MNILFLMKPLDTIQAPKDTSLLLMQAAEKQGHTLYYLPQGGISLRPQGLLFDCIKIKCTYCLEDPITPLKKCSLPSDDVHAVFIRTDPPFDTAYLHDMWLLDHLPPHIKCVNSSKGIRDVNEKIWTAQFKEIIPKTVITSSQDHLLDMIRKEKKIILKPTDGFGGQSIFIVSENDPNKHVILETVTQNETQYVIAQKYIDAAKQGDKRILLCDGNPIGAVLRVHNGTDHRNNFFAGGIPKKSTLTPHDHTIISTIYPYLKSHGLRFVGIDVIGDYLIEINVTSPTCLNELNTLENKNYEHEIVQTLLAN